MKQRATIYPTLWKPLMIKGVPRDYSIVLVLFSVIMLLLTGRLVVGFITFALGWGFGMIMARIDPEFFTVWVVKVLRIKKTKGNYKGNEYLS